MILADQYFPTRLELKRRMCGIAFEQVKLLLGTAADVVRQLVEQLPKRPKSLVSKAHLSSLLLAAIAKIRTFSIR